MGLADLMDWFENEYISGCQTYYCRFNPNPWHQTHENMVSEIKAAVTFDAKSAVILKFKKVFERLLARYQKSGPNLKDVRPWDAFYGGNHSLEVISTFGRECIECERNDVPLKLIADKRTKLSSMKCGACK